MKQLQPVIWTKGTFLTPQYLQAQDRFLEDTLNFRLQALSYCPSGFTELVVDPGRLAEGQFLISRASGIFPDGLLFDIPEADPAPPSKAVAEFFGPGVNELDLYLAVPDYRERGLNVSAASRDFDTRFRAEVALLRDENTGTGEKPVQTARKNFRILADPENRQGYSVLRVARLERTPAGGYRSSASSVPPLLNIHASDYILGVLRGLIEVLSAKSTQLAGRRREKNLSLAEFTSSDVADFWLLYTVNSHFPIFHHLLESKGAHPEELYSAMTALASALTTFSSEMRPQDLPLYDHDRLGEIFSELNEKLRTLLETVVPTNVVSLPLKKVQNFIYATSLADEKYLADTRMFLAVYCDNKEEEIIRRVPQLVKVCSATHVEHLIKQALPGVQLTHSPSPPSAIPVKLKYQYFSLNQGGPAWEAVRKARNFAAFVPGEFANPDLELIILLPRRTKS